MRSLIGSKLSSPETNLRAFFYKSVHFPGNFRHFENEIALAVAVDVPKPPVVEPIGQYSGMATVGCIVTEWHAAKQKAEIGQKIVRVSTTYFSAEPESVKREAVWEFEREGQSGEIDVQNRSARTVAGHSRMRALNYGETAPRDHIDRGSGMKPMREAVLEHAFGRNRADDVQRYRERQLK